jgi:hypothetical protein
VRATRGIPPCPGRITRSTFRTRRPSSPPSSTSSARCASGADAFPPLGVSPTRRVFPSKPREWLEANVSGMVEPRRRQLGVIPSGLPGSSYNPRQLFLALIPGTRLGVYEVTAIGAGDMGEAYRAHDTKLNRDVALKVLLPEVADILNAWLASGAKRRSSPRSMIQRPRTSSGWLMAPT